MLDAKSFNSLKTLITTFKMKGNHVVEKTTVSEKAAAVTEQIKQTSSMASPMQGITKQPLSPISPEETARVEAILETITKTTVDQPPIEKEMGPAQKQLEALKSMGKTKQSAAGFGTVVPIVSTSNVSTSIPYYIVSQDYYLCMDKAGVLFYKFSYDGLPTILRKPLAGGCALGASTIKQSIIPDNKLRHQRSMGINLTQAEFDNILKGKPSIDDLLSVYDQYSNDTIGIDISKAIPVW